MWEKQHPGIFGPSGTRRIYSQLSALIHMQNEGRWRYRLAPYPYPCTSPLFTMDCQVAGGSAVPWHTDYISDASAKDKEFEPKLVGLIQLSSPEDYDGGAFEVYSGTQIIRQYLEHHLTGPNHNCFPRRGAM